MTVAGSGYMLNRFDVGIELWLNHFVGHRPYVDRIILYANSSYLTSLVLVLLVWLAVFDARRRGQLRERHEMIFGAALFAMLATLVARAIAVSLPFRARPIAASSLHFRTPPDASLALIHWSAFPSDHAALFSALACGIIPVSRRLGWFAVIWVIFASFLPLLYLGVHWPTDILGGILLGAGFVQLVRVPAVHVFLRRNVELFYAKRPALFITLFFLWSFEAAVLFTGVRKALYFLVLHY